MQNTTNEIVTTLIAKLPDPTEIIYTITMRDLVSAIVRRIGVDALALTDSDLQLARDEVQAAIGHHLDEREFIDIGLDAWEMVRKVDEP